MVLCCASVGHWLLGGANCEEEDCDKCHTPANSVVTDTPANSEVDLVTDTLTHSEAVTEENGEVIATPGHITPESSDFSITPPESEDLVSENSVVFMNPESSVIIVTPEGTDITVVTPVAIILGKEDALSALPPSPLLLHNLSPAGKAKLKKSSSMIDQTAIWNSSVLSGLPPKRRARSLTAIDKIKSNLGVKDEPEFRRRLVSQEEDISVRRNNEISGEYEDTVFEDLSRQNDETIEENKETEDTVDKLPQKKKSYVSSDIDDMKERKTSLIGITSSGFEVKLK